METVADSLRRLRFSFPVVRYERCELSCVSFCNFSSSLTSDAIFPPAQSIHNNDIPTVYRANPILLDVGLALSVASALIANLALILRVRIFHCPLFFRAPTDPFLRTLFSLQFLERRVARWTMVAILSLAIHDAINVTAIVTFGVVHRFNDGYVVSIHFSLLSERDASSFFSLPFFLFPSSPALYSFSSTPKPSG